MTYRPRRRTTYAPLAADYFEDDAIMRAGPTAELLYVRSLAYCARSGSDGFLTDAQVRLIARGIRNTTRTTANLSRTGLWIRDDARGGFTIRSWLKWNPSQEQIAAARQRDAERKRQVPRRPFPPDSGRNPRGIQPPDTDTDPDTDTESAPPPLKGRGGGAATGGRPRDARGAARPPERQWARDIAQRTSAAVPDLSQVRAALADASRSHKARANRRTGAFEELLRVTANGTQSHEEGRGA